MKKPGLTGLWAFGFYSFLFLITTKDIAAESNLQTVKKFLRLKSTNDFSAQQDAASSLSQFLLSINLRHNVTEKTILLNSIATKFVCLEILSGQPHWLSSLSGELEKMNYKLAFSTLANLRQSNAIAVDEHKFVGINALSGDPPSIEWILKENYTQLAILKHEFVHVEQSIAVKKGIVLGLPLQMSIRLRDGDYSIFEGALKSSYGKSHTLDEYLAYERELKIYKKGVETLYIKYLKKGSQETKKEIEHLIKGMIAVYDAIDQFYATHLRLTKKIRSGGIENLRSVPPSPAHPYTREILISLPERSIASPTFKNTSHFQERSYILYNANQLKSYSNNKSTRSPIEELSLFNMVWNEQMANFKMIHETAKAEVLWGKGIWQNIKKLPKGH